jgi:ribosomal protein L11 methylase PrmA
LDEKIPGNYFDIVVANLTRAEIIKLFDKMSSALTENGLLILSGIQNKEKKKMEEFLLRESLLIKEDLSEEGWVCFIAQKVKK